MSKFLDYPGLGHFKSKVDNKIGQSLLSYKEEEPDVTWESGYVKKADGTIGTSSNNIVAVIPLGNAKRVRFLGLITATDSYSSGYAFYNGDTVVSLSGWDYGSEASAAKEYIIPVPEGATTLKVTSWISRSDTVPVLTTDFYCYLQYGNSVTDAIDSVQDELTGTRKNYESGKYLGSTGQLGSNSSAILSSYIPVLPGDVIVWHHGYTANKTAYCLCAFDENKQFISGLYWTCNATPYRTITLGSNSSIAYIRATCSSDAALPFIKVNGVIAWQKQETRRAIDNNLALKDMRLDTLDSYMGISRTKPTLSIGSLTNAGNMNLVHTNKVSVTPGKKYRFVTNRPADEGFNYDYGFATYDGDTQKRSQSTSASSPLRDSTVTMASSENGLVYTIGQSDDNGNRSALSIADFEGYDFFVEEVSGTMQNLQNASQEIENIKAAQTEISVAMRDGSVGNTGNSSWITMSKMTSMRGATMIQVMAPFEISPGSHVRWQVAFADAASEGGTYADATNKTLKDIYAATRENYLTIVVPSGYSTFMVGMIEYLADGSYVARRKADYPTTTINFSYSYELLRMYREDVGTIPMSGNDATMYEKIIYLKKNVAYKIDLPDTMWEVSSDTTDSYVVFNLRAYDGSYHDVLAFSKETAFTAYRKSRVIYTNTYDAQFYSLRIRAKKGVIIDVNFTELANRRIDECEYDKVKMLLNACRYHLTSNTSKDFQLLELTDHHGETRALQNARRYTEFFDTIDGMAICGDIVPSHPGERSSVTTFGQEVVKCAKPFYIVLGNHDAGNWDNVAVGASHSQGYEWFIKPMVDKGILANGEYTEGLPYWYHDIPNYKVRIIGLYEYDSDLALADNSYWEPVEYDDNAAELQYNHNYAIGDIIKCGNYVDHCFRCTAAVKTGANYYTDTDKIPHYKLARGAEVYRQTQAQWFLDTLASTPANYGVIIMKHFTLGNTAEAQPDRMFSKTSATGPRTEAIYMNDWMPEAIEAFVNGTSYSKKVQFSGAASYMNTLNDGSIDYAYEISKDFSQKNSGTYYLGSLAGHRHRDLIFKHPTYNQWQVRPCCGITDSGNNSSNDIRRSYNGNTSFSDSLTVISFAPGRLALVKIGVNVTMYGERRDFEVIDTTVESS